MFLYYWYNCLKCVIKLNKSLKELIFPIEMLLLLNQNLSLLELSHRSRL